MSDDLVKRLRHEAGEGYFLEHAMMLKAADRIDALEAALRECVAYDNALIPVEDEWHEGYRAGTGDVADIARAALDGTPDERDVANVPENEWQTNG